MRKREEDHGGKWMSAMGHVLIGSGLAFAASLAILAVGAALISAGRISEGAAEQVCLCAGFLGCLLGGLYSVLRCRCRALPVGLSVGGSFYLLWITAALLTQGTAEAGGDLRVLCAGLLGGGVAAFLGAQPKKRRKGLK